MSSVFDIGLDSDGDFPLLPKHITGTALVLQRIAIRLHTFRGEWIVDASKGLPILRWMGEKPFDADLAGAEVRLQIETTPGVLQVESFATVFDQPGRSVIFSGRVILEDESLEFEIAPTLSAVDLDNRNQTPMVVFFQSGHIIARF